MSVINALMSACQDMCSEYGEPACYDVVKDNPELGEWKACRNCLIACGLPEPDERLDPDAVVRPLL